MRIPARAALSRQWYVDVVIDNTPRVLDCHHNDITDIVRDRAEMRPHLKAIRRRRYLRQYERQRRQRL